MHAKVETQPMDLESHRRWYDYSRARDAMFAATDHPSVSLECGPNRRQGAGSINCISHLLSVVPWKEIVQEKVKLPKRQKPKGYKDPDWNYPLRSSEVLNTTVKRLRQARTDRRMAWKRSVAMV